MLSLFFLISFIPLSAQSPDEVEDTLILTLFPSGAFEDGALSLYEVDRDYSGDASDLTLSNESVVPDDEYVAAYNVFYEVTVMGLSEDIYRYCLAQYKSRSDFLARMGLAPAQFAWSNVSGGFGFCGAINPISCSWAESAVLTESCPH